MEENVIKYPKFDIILKETLIRIAKESFIIYNIKKRESKEWKKA